MDKGYGKDEIFGLLYATNELRCKPPLEKDELAGIVSSATSRYERGRFMVSEPDDEVGILLSDVQAEKVDWLWDRRVPLGKLTILEGDPDKGKSLITLDLAARLTTGRRLPGDQDDHHEQGEHDEHLEHLTGGVVILSAEDGLADTIKPRLLAAGADTSRVLALTTVPDSEGNERDKHPEGYRPYQESHHEG